MNKTGKIISLCFCKLGRDVVSSNMKVAYTEWKSEPGKPQMTLMWLSKPLDLVTIVDLKMYLGC